MKKNEVRIAEHSVGFKGIMRFYPWPYALSGKIQQSILEQVPELRGVVIRELNGKKPNSRLGD
jgi:hypothetical protein